jgi:hypothetical protein
MRNELCPFRFVVYTFCFLGLFSLQAYAQEKDHTQDADHQKDHPNGIVQDWSRRHVVYPRFGPIQSLISLQHDPRAILSWQAAEREDWHRAKDRDSDKDGDKGHGHSHGKKSGLQRDWSISLGTGTTAPAMYPAKYSFYVDATPSCTNDFVVFPVNVAGGTNQPNIVAFNNLYSGTTGSTGICNAPANGRTAGPNDDGVSATTIWSYNITAAGGVVSTSPALSLDGTKVAFVETGSGSTAHFHVLAPKTGDGVATNLQDVTSTTKQITGGFALSAPAPGTVTDLALVPSLGTASDTLSSPFVDYVSDVAYIGNDSGTLFRVKNVFCTLATCAGAAPSLDLLWGPGGALATGCLGALTAPVVDLTGNVFVGCSDGTLYGFDFMGVALSGSGTAVGDNSVTGGIVDPPLVDVVNGFVYVVSGSSGETSVLAQFSANNLSPSAAATFGVGGPTGFNLHTPAFNDAYFSSTNSANWLIYEWALSLASDGVTLLDTLYGVGFNSSHTMNSGAPADIFPIPGSTASEFSPVTEILNSPADFVVVSALESAFPNMAVYNVNAFTPSLFPNVFPPTGTQGATTAEGNGTTGIVVDNVSISAQASSIYFGVPSLNTAVKLTQSGLN